MDINKKLHIFKIYDAASCLPIPNVSIILSDEFDTKKIVVESNFNGEWEFQLDLGFKPDTISFKKDGYVEKELQLKENLPSIIRLLNDDIIGYLDKLWFKSGETVTVYAHSSKSFSAELFRHGLNKSSCLQLGDFEPIQQEIPNDFFVENGLDWKTSFQFNIPKEIKAGIFSIQLKDLDGNKFAIPFIVSSLSQKKKNKILVLASSNNWQCYNLWGGRSRYRSYEDEQPKPPKQMSPLKKIIFQTVGKLIPKQLKIFLFNSFIRTEETPKKWMLKPLSIRRPFTNCNLEADNVFSPFTNHLAAGEWRVLSWLEREGIEYDMISGYELHNNPSALEGYKGIVLSTHCEYWSKAMFESLKKYHIEQNLWILNISGNSIYREVDFLLDGSIQCKSLYFKNSVADETEIIGVRFDSRGYGTCDSYKVLNPNHWIFDNSPINEQNLIFGTSSLNQNTIKERRLYDPGRSGNAYGLIGMGASGWETDKLSKTAPEDIELVAEGMNNKNTGGAQMIIRMPNGKRGGLFSASSITFGGSLLIDATSSQLLKNILNKVLAN